LTKEQKKQRFISLNVIEDGKSITKIDLPPDFLRKVSWSENMSKPELLRALWGKVYFIPNKQAEELLQQKGVITNDR